MTTRRTARSRRSHSGPPRPYLKGTWRLEFDAWLSAARERHSPPLTTPEIRKGIRAISSLYVERRGEERIGPRAVEGAGKRAALATYFGPLHFLTVCHTLAEPGFPSLGFCGRILDLGCGTGVVGAALARSCQTLPEVLAVDRSGWALGEARHTYAGFGVPARVRRASLPQILPRRPRRRRAEECIVLGWVLNELDPLEREQCLNQLSKFIEEGGHCLLMEPLSGRISPWWQACAVRLADLGVVAGEVRWQLELPDWIRSLDRAAGLDHRELGARVLIGPGNQSSAERS